MKLQIIPRANVPGHNALFLDGKPVTENSIYMCDNIFKIFPAKEMDVFAKNPKKIGFKKYIFELNSSGSMIYRSKGCVNISTVTESENVKAILPAAFHGNKVIIWARPIPIVLLHTAIVREVNIWPPTRFSFLIKNETGELRTVSESLCKKILEFFPIGETQFALSPIKGFIEHKFIYKNHVLYPDKSDSGDYLIAPEARTIFSLLPSLSGRSNFSIWIKKA